MRHTLLALPLLLAACVPAGPAPQTTVAAFWAGDWTTNPAHCANRGMIGEAEQAPIRLTATSTIGLENFCSIESVSGPDASGRTALALSCMGEGMAYSRTQLVRLLPDGRLEITYPGSASILYTRCPE